MSEPETAKSPTPAQPAKWQRPVSSPQALTYFAARDRFDQAVIGGELGGPVTSLYLLSFLLAHAWYTGDRRGWVSRKVTGADRLARATGMCERTVKVALSDLERAGWLARERRYEQGKRQTDDVYLRALDLWFPGLGSP